MQIDFNCDMGESFGPDSFGSDEELMRHISSANVAGGFHAGDPHVMRETVALAREHGVAVGLHNGYGDLVGFGGGRYKVAPEEIRDELIYQLGALREFARLYGMEVQHVKPHGALYMVAARDEELSRAIIEAIQEVRPGPRPVLHAILGDLRDRPGDGPAGRERSSSPTASTTTRARSSLPARVTEELDPEEVADRVVRAVTEGRVTTVRRQRDRGGCGLDLRPQ